MKILHVETGRHYYGGPQQVIYLMRALGARGVEGTLVCPPGSGIDAAARAESIPVRNLFCAGDLDLPFAYRLTQYVNETKPDLVHCHSRRGADVLGGLAASFTDTRAVVSRRVDNTEMRLAAALRYRPFDKIIAISNAVAAVLADRGIDPHRIEVILDAVDVDRFSEPVDRAAVRRMFGIPETAFFVAAAGQLIARKGHRYLIDATAELVAAGAPIRVVIFGVGPEDDDLRAQAATLGLEDTVQFAGFRDDLDDLMGGFDLFAHPALAEGLGVVTLKAQAAGVPVVGFEAGGLAEAVEHGVSGLLVPAGDGSALALAIRSLMDDDAMRARLGAAGRDRMRAQFSIESMADRHIELYEALVHG